MNTRDVIGTGFSFLFVIIVLHIIGFVLFTQLGMKVIGVFGSQAPPVGS
jgi:hypothetical protein